LANAHSNIVAVKEASGDMAQIKDIIQRKPENFRVISGDDALALQVVKVGGSGVISVLGNALPTEVSTMIRTALNSQFEPAKNQHNKLQDLIKLAFEEGSPIGIKAMMHVLGFCENQLRLPMVASSDSLLIRIRTALEPF
jgi:4-hydroxy-tetrahydrodipicolinate synthase